MELESPILTKLGLHYVSYRLSQLGWNVVPVQQKSRGIDIAAYNRDHSHFIGVQVRTQHERARVPIGTDLDRITGHFWIAVNRAESTPTAYVLLPDEVKERASSGERRGRMSYWLEPNSYEVDEFREAWDRIPTP